MDENKGLKFFYDQIIKNDILKIPKKKEEDDAASMI